MYIISNNLWYLQEPKKRMFKPLHRPPVRSPLVPSQSHQAPILSKRKRRRKKRKRRRKVDQRTRRRQRSHVTREQHLKKGKLKSELFSLQTWDCSITVWPVWFNKKSKLKASEWESCACPFSCCLSTISTFFLAGWWCNTSICNYDLFPS